MSDLLEQSGSASRATTPEQFAVAAEYLAPHEIVVVKPDEYADLASLTHEEARDLPDGVYLVDETVRERLAEADVTYEDLNRAALSFAEAKAHETDAEAKEAGLGARLKLGRENSAHQVFFGTINLHGEHGQSPVETAIAIKPHHEKGELSAKPFKELGNLAMLQDFGHEGIYKPLGLIKRGGIKYVLTEGKVGIKTLDSREWIGSKKYTQSKQFLSREQREALHSEDVELVGQVLEMLGDSHARGVFHLDAQMKNIGWLNLAQVEPPKPGVDKQAASRTSNLAGVKLTLVDMENAKVFKRDGAEDYSEDYYEQLAELAVIDIVQFMDSVPIRSRVPRGYHAGRPNGNGYEELYAELYLDSFMNSRQKVLGQDAHSLDDEFREVMKKQIVTKLEEINNPVSDREARAARFKALESS